jgi:uncharacterized membrane protein YdjX (TVP38/TMEM64 family)
MDKDSSNAKRWIKLLVLAVFMGGFVGFFVLGGSEWLSLENLKAQRDGLLSYTENHYVIMLLLAVLVYTAATALSVPGAVILSLAVGLMFGRWVGTVLIVVSATLGATLVFLAARYLFAEAVQKRVGGLGKKLTEGFNEGAFNYLLFLRLVPLFPFWLVNLAPAVLTKIGTRPYVAATLIGIIPGSFVFANLGQSLGRIESLSQLLSWETIGALVLLGGFALLPLFIKKIRTKTA